MQIYIVSWSFSNSEDQSFATREFCNSLNEEKINRHCDGFELINCYHFPQDGTGIVICKTENLKKIYEERSRREKKTLVYLVIKFPGVSFFTKVTQLHATISLVSMLMDFYVSDFYLYHSRRR